MNEMLSILSGALSHYHFQGFLMTENDALIVFQFNNDPLLVIKCQVEQI